jgi:hypothetical protein
MTIREWRGRASAEQTEAGLPLAVRERARSHALSNQLGIHHLGGATERGLLTTVAEVREPLEGTFSLNLSAIHEFDRAIARSVGGTR